MRFGPRNTMAAGSALMAAGSALIILVEWLPAGVWSYWLIGSWLLLWAGAALHTVNGIPYLMTLSSPAQRDYAFAAQSSATALFSFAGSLLAGFLPALYAARLGLSLELPGAYRLGLWSAPIVFLLAAVAILLVRPVTLARPDASLGAANRRPVGILLFVTLTIFLMSAVAGAVRSFFNVYLDSGLALSTARIGLIMGVGQLLPAVAALSAPVLMAPARARTRVLAHLPGGGAVPAAAGHGGGLGCGRDQLRGRDRSQRRLGSRARNVFTQLCVGPEWRTSASASATIGTGLGWAAMAVLGGFVIEAWGFAALFGMAAVLAFAERGASAGLRAAGPLSRGGDGGGGLRG